jgi:hypothetical protein
MYNLYLIKRFFSAFLNLTSVLIVKKIWLCFTCQALHARILFGDMLLKRLTLHHVSGSETYCLWYSFPRVWSHGDSWLVLYFNELVIAHGKMV